MVFKTYKGLVSKIAEDIYESSTASNYPEEFDNDLLKDIEQDVWLELLTLKKIDPEITDSELRNHLEQTAVPVDSLPNPRIVYTDLLDEIVFP